MAEITTQFLATTEASIWNRLIRPEKMDLSPEAAAFFLQIEFDSKNRERMHELALKAQEGALREAERKEIASYEPIGTFLSIMKSKARKVLRNGNPAWSRKGTQLN